MAELKRNRVMQIAAGGIILLLLFTLYPKNNNGDLGATFGGYIEILDANNNALFSAGSDETVFNSIKNWLFGFNVLKVGQTKLDSSHTISVLGYADWIVKSPPDNTVNTQYLMAYSTQLTGDYITGLRARAGNQFIDCRTYNDCNGYTETLSTNRFNSLDLTGTSFFVKDYYNEVGSGLNAGNINYGVLSAASFVDAFNGIPIADNFASDLAGLLGTENIKDGHRNIIGGFQEPASTFYVDVQRIQWNPLSSGGISLNLGDFTAGHGKWAAFEEGDKYRMNFRINYIYRFQDVTGEWSDFKAGYLDFAYLDFEVVEGTWVVVDIEAGGQTGLWGG